MPNAVSHLSKSIKGRGTYKQSPSLGCSFATNWIVSFLWPVLSPLLSRWTLGRPSYRCYPTTHPQHQRECLYNNPHISYIKGGLYGELLVGVFSLPFLLYLTLLGRVMRRPRRAITPWRPLQDEDQIKYPRPHSSISIRCFRVS